VIEKTLSSWIETSLPAFWLGLSAFWAASKALGNKNLHAKKAPQKSVKPFYMEMHT
jgi:hypothetical protein